MAAPFSTTNKIGSDLNTITLAADVAAGKVRDARIGDEVFTSDGKIAVYVIAGGAIPASTATCTVNTSTFAATATGGSYTSPAVAMAAGDYGWMKKASV